MIDEDRPVYSDTGYFTRGRSGIRRETRTEKHDALWSLFALFLVGCVFGLIVHFVR